MVDGPYKFDALCDLEEVTIPDPNSKTLPVGTIFTQRCETEPSSIAVGSVKLVNSDDPNEPYMFLGADGEWHVCNPDGTKYLRADFCAVSGGVATFPNSPVTTLIAAARTLCDNVETVGTHNRIDTEHIDKLRQALDGL